MTEYGRGPGAQPWYPEDPLFGDQGWNGGQPGSHPDPHWDPYAAQQAPQAQQFGPDQVPYPDQVPHPEQIPYQEQTAYPGQYPPQGDWSGAAAAYQAGYDAGPVTDPYGIPPADPYGPDPYGPDPYGTAELPVYQAPAAHPGYPDGYATEYAYPPPQPQHLRDQPGPVTEPPGPQHPVGPDPETGWDPGPDQGESAFFSGGDDSADDRGRPGREGRVDGRTRRGGTKRKKNGCACLFVSLVLAGGLGTVGYFGYDYYSAHFAPAPDYEGSGNGEVQVRIPSGAALADMGSVLEREGVVQSSGAFVEAANANKKAQQGISPGTYTLKKEMSGSSAVDLMLDPTSQNGFIVAEGLRAKAVYRQIDKKLEVTDGTTEKTAKTADLGLPKWAKGSTEGFLFPSKYSVGKNSKPADVLRQMVKRAESEYQRVGLQQAAQKTGKSPRDIITVASLIQAEAQQDDEFGKVSRVIYNRLDKNMPLGFDSTINYAMGRSTLNTSVSDTHYRSPYNTYDNRGLPPGPIGNPGHQAIEAASKPTKGNWLYFVTVKPGDTRFTASKAEHDRNVGDFNEAQRKQRQGQ